MWCSMALDNEYFDSINIDVVKKKYYNANKVNAVLDDIRTQALALSDENSSLRTQLDAFKEQKVEIGEAVMSAQQLYREIVAKARQRAAEITSKAEADAKKIVESANAEAEEITAQAESQRSELEKKSNSTQEYAVRRVESVFSSLREQYETALESLNTEWQEFLIGLDSQDETAENEESLPDDIGTKLSAIADGLKDLGK